MNSSIGSPLSVPNLLVANSVASPFDALLLSVTDIVACHRFAEALDELLEVYHIQGNAGMLGAHLMSKYPSWISHQSNGNGIRGRVTDGEGFKVLNHIVPIGIRWSEF
jgi:hypothetical protein